MSRNRGRVRGWASSRSAAWGALLLLALAAESRAEDNIRQGPFCLQGQSLFQVLRLTMVPWCERPLAKGQFELQTFATWVNLWAWKPNQYLIDGESVRFRAALSYGLLDRLQVRLEIPAVLWTGGLMDTAVDGFHRAFNLSNPYESDFPKNRFRIVLYPPEGGEVRLDSRDTRLELSDLILSLKGHLFEGTRYLPAVLLGADLKIPTGFNEGGGVDVDGNVFLAKRVWRFYGYVGVQYTYYAKDEILGIPLNHEQWSFLTGMEAAVTERLSLLVQFFMDTGPAVDFYEYSLCAYELSGGAKYAIGQRTQVELGVIENLIHYDNTPDAGLHFGVTHRFP